MLTHNVNHYSGFKRRVGIGVLEALHADPSFEEFSYTESREVGGRWREMWGQERVF